MKAEEIERLAVVGAGQMGAQIAMQAALHGLSVSLHDVEASQLEKALAANRGHLEKRVAKGKLGRDEMERALSRVTPTASLEQAARQAQFVIEAVVEKLEEKRAVFARLDTICPSQTILATNSSYLTNSEIATATARPDRVVNMHFFYPPLVMRLVEVVKGEKTSEETVEVTAQLARRMGREPVVLRKAVPGFLVNHVLRAISNDVYWLLENGVASFADIDKALEMGLGWPMGPFRLGDFSGLDVGYYARQEAYAKYGHAADKPPESLRKRVERGDLGRKTGRGFYDYSTDPPKPTED